MTEPFLSIIIPVYNAGKTLIRCVGSILPEAPKSCEIFLVDDGSTDGSAALCDGFAKADARIRAIHQKNAGAAAARNAALAVAQGSFVQFVDADDYLNSGLYASVLPHLTPDVDLAVFGLQNLNGAAPDSLPSGHMQGLAPLAESIEYYMVQTGILNSPVNKFYRRSLIADTRFDTDLPIFEDFKFNMQVLRGCGGVWWEPTLFYACDNRGDGSLSRRFRTDLLACEAVVQPHIQAFLAGLGLSPARQTQILTTRQQTTSISQCAILLGRRGGLSFAQYRRLYADILRPPHVRRAVLHWVCSSYTGAARLVYAAAVRLHLHGLLAWRSTHLKD